MKKFFPVSSNKRKILTMVGACVLLLVSVFLFVKKNPNQTPCSRCNILLMDIDTFRADELPCYGYRRNTAPTICSFAKQSIQFNDNYSTSYWTLPSMFSTITSLVPTFHQVRTEFVDTLSPKIPTLAEILQKKGYRTIFVGFVSSATVTKDNGGLRGYDKVIQNQTVTQVIAGLSKSKQPWFIHAYYTNLHMPYLLAKGVKPMENLIPPPGFPVTDTEFYLLLSGYIRNHLSDVFSKTALEEYHSIIYAQDKPGSFALASLFYKLAQKDETKYIVNDWMPVFTTYMNTFDRNNPDHVAFVRMLYDTRIRLLDTQLKPLFYMLRTEPLINNTIAVISSEHGEAFGEHGIFSHTSDYHSELFYTPLIIHVPGYRAKHVEQSSSNMDILPTLLELLGAKPLAGIQGQSLIPYFGNPRNSGPRLIWSEDVDGLILQNKYWLYYLPKNSSDIGVSVLYNRTSDPSEKTNVTAKYPELTEWAFEQASLLDSYNAINAQTRSVPGYNNIKLDPEKVKRLQKEGYF